MKDNEHGLGNEFRQDGEAWRQRAAFWMSAFMSNVKRNLALGFETGPEHELMRQMLHDYIIVGLENADFRPDNMNDLRSGDVFPGANDDAVEGLIERMDGNVPMSIAIEICAAADVNVVEILTEYVENTSRNLAYAATLLRPYTADSAPAPFSKRFYGEGPVVTKVPLGALSPEEADEVFKWHFPDAYLLHVLHGERPCRHPYDSLGEAIEGAAIEEMSGAITAATHVTHRDALVMDRDELRMNIDRIKNAGMN